jgi:uncharacterized protein (DUF1684 family)
MDDLEQFRHDKNELFAKGEESPLTPEQKAAFKGLNYYPANEKFILKSVPLEPETDITPAPIKTSQGDTENYKKLGKLKFELEGKPCELGLFESSSGNLFLSFRDETNKEETYHDGRYIEVELENNIVPEIDFNYAYNPYCAYNDKWRCPITPEENTLPLELKAGEKRFH